MTDTTGTIKINGTGYCLTGEDLQAFAIGVPHREPAYIDDPAESPPIAEDGDNLIAGDHDLNIVHLIEAWDDVVRLIGDPLRHQRHKISALIADELLDQGVIEEAGE